jgi:hypothetical protein
VRAACFYQITRPRRMSESGTTRTCRDVRSMSVIEGISEVKYSLQVFRILTQSGLFRLAGPTHLRRRAGRVCNSAAGRADSLEQVVAAKSVVPTIE